MKSGVLTETAKIAFDKQMLSIQRDIVDQQTLHKYKDLERNKTMRKLFEEFIEISGSSADVAEKVERLRRKVNHDLEH